MAFEEFEEPTDFLHKAIGGTWLVWLLILGHVFAALYHHLANHNRTLQKVNRKKQVFLKSANRWLGNHH